MTDYVGPNYHELIAAVSIYPHSWIVHAQPLAKLYERSIPQTKPVMASMAISVAKNPHRPTR
jgi:hypothetical protein